jgi:hypothetical protein
MICRMWTGFTARENADAYETYLRTELFPRLQRELAHAGYRGFHLLRRERGDETEFVTMVWFLSIDAVRALAGDGYEVPVISETAARLLAHYAELAGRRPARHVLRRLETTPRPIPSRLSLSAAANARRAAA